MNTELEDLNLKIFSFIDNSSLELHFYTPPSLFTLQLILYFFDESNFFFFLNLGLYFMYESNFHFKLLQPFYFAQWGS